MNPARLAGIPASVQHVIAEVKQETVAQNATGREEARADIEIDSGFRVYGVVVRTGETTAQPPGRPRRVG